MPSRPADPEIPPRIPGGFAQILKTTLQGSTRIVRDMHGAISGHAFGALSRVPLIGAPARLVAGAHDAIANGVYTAIHQVGGGALDLAGVLEQRLASKAPALLPVGIRSALNGAFGDHLDASNSALAIPMRLISADQPLKLDRESLAQAFPHATPRICVFVHGLGCSDRSWQTHESDQVDFAAELARAFGYTSLYLRYNSGLPIASNGVTLSAMLGELVNAWPARPVELLLIGHSMGGLLARSALEQAGANSRWARATHMLICLGSPNTGAPLARHGQQLQRALDAFSVTAPLGRLGAARSRGVKDLHDGLSASSASTWPHIAQRFVGAHLGAEPDGVLASLFGDGLVPLSSATTLDGYTPTTSTVLPDVGHLGLLNDPRAWTQIRTWLSE